MLGPDRCSIPLYKVYDPREYVTLVTPAGDLTASYANGLGSLVVYLYDSTGAETRGSFSFMVLDPTP